MTSTPKGESRTYKRAFSMRFNYDMLISGVRCPQNVTKAAAEEEEKKKKKKKKKKVGFTSLIHQVRQAS